MNRKAEVVTEYIHNGYCADCAEGGGDGTEETAEAWVDAHNAEYHEGAE